MGREMPQNPLGNPGSKALVGLVRGALPAIALLLPALVLAADPAGGAEPVEIPFAVVLRQYMYWFIAAGAAMVVMLLTTSYVTRLNTALRGEIVTRKQAEASLRESVERFENIVACSGDWIWETDCDGRFIYTSAIVRDMLGREPGEVLGRRQVELLTAAERERAAPALEKIYAEKKRIFREKYKFVTKDGRVVIHESTAEPVVDARGELQGYRGVNRDVTGQVRFIRL